MYWLDNNLKKFVDEFTSEKIIKKRGIFNYDKLKIIRQLNKDRKIDASYTIFSIVCYEIWSQKFIDKSNNDIKKSFRPKKPKKWRQNKNEWLTTSDIERIVK